MPPAAASTNDESSSDDQTMPGLVGEGVTLGLSRASSDASMDGGSRMYRPAGSSGTSMGGLDGVEALDDDDAGTLSSGSSRSPITPTEEFQFAADEILRWHRENGEVEPGRQSARLEYSRMLAVVPLIIESDAAFQQADPDTALLYLEVFEQLRTADPEAAQIVWLALSTSTSLLNEESPLQALQGQIMVIPCASCGDGPWVVPCAGCGQQGNFVGFERDSGRQADASPHSDRRILLTRSVRPAAGAESRRSRTHDPKSAAPMCLTSLQPS